MKHVPTTSDKVWNAFRALRELTEADFSAVAVDGRCALRPLVQDTMHELRLIMNRNRRFSLPEMCDLCKLHNPAATNMVVNGDPVTKRHIISWDEDHDGVVRCRSYVAYDRLHEMEKHPIPTSSQDKRNAWFYLLGIADSYNPEGKP